MRVHEPLRLELHLEVDEAEYAAAQDAQRAHQHRNLSKQIKIRNTEIYDYCLILYFYTIRKIKYLFKLNEHHLHANLLIEAFLYSL